MSDILYAQKAFSKLLDVEYEFILGRKNKTISLILEFQKIHFFHIAGLQHLKDLPRLSISAEDVYNQIESGQLSVNYIESSINYGFIRKRIECLLKLEQFFDSNDTVFRYNPALHAFSVIEADFIMKNMIDSIPVFTFVSKGKNGKYFCKSFFSDIKKDYTERQEKWTLLFKKKSLKSGNTEIVLYKHKTFEFTNHLG